MHDQRLRRRHPVFHVSIYLPLAIGAALVFIAYAWFPGALPALVLTGIVVIVGFGLPRWIGKGEREQRAQDAMDRELATWGFHGRDREGAWINYIDRPLVKQTDIARGKYFYGEWLAIHDGYIVVNPGLATVDGVAGQVTYHSDQPRTYAWDGCSPKLSFYWLALIGTPDWWQRIEPVQFVDAGGRLGTESVPKTMFWPKAHHASLVHDALYQYLGLIPISKRTADRLFQDMLVDSGMPYPLAVVYRWAVQLFGGWEVPGDLEARSSSWTVAGFPFLPPRG